MPNPSTRQPARQQRSRQSLQRMLDATVTLLEHHDFDAVSVQEICDEAGVAVGTFYTRFASKDDLLPYLYEQYDQALERTVERQLASVSKHDDVQDRVRAAVRLVIRLYREHRGLWRAMHVFALAHPDCIGQAFRNRRAAQLRQVVDAIVGRKRHRAVRISRRRVEDALMVLMAVCKDQILLADTARGITPKRSERALRTCLTDMLMTYVTPGEEQ